jgi:hypothetical protein
VNFKVILWVEFNKFYAEIDLSQIKVETKKESLIDFYEKVRINLSNFL